jgi:hypothetical protein
MCRCVMHVSYSWCAGSNRHWAAHRTGQRCLQPSHSQSSRTSRRMRMAVSNCLTSHYMQGYHCSDLCRPAWRHCFKVRLINFCSILDELFLAEHRVLERGEVGTINVIATAVFNQEHIVRFDFPLLTGENTHNIDLHLEQVRLFLDW